MGPGRGVQGDLGGVGVHRVGVGDGHDEAGADGALREDGSEDGEM